ncbi:MAG: DnaB-like helicase C-terminal domain-containing protein [Bacteroidales bacterium]
MIDCPEKTLQLKENFFLSEDGKDLYGVLLSLKEKGVKPTVENIVGVGNNINQNITPELYKLIVSSSYDEEAFEHYRYLLQEAYAQEAIQTRVLKELSKSVTTKGRLDIERIEDFISELQDCVSLAKNSSSDILFTKDLFNDYERTIERRIEGEEFRTTGCSKLDNLLPTGFSQGEITTIFGSTGVGKSTFALYLKNRLINRDIPCLDFTLEMSGTATMDRWMASRLRIPMRELVGKPNEPINEEILQMVQNEKAKLLTRKRYGMVDASSITVAEIKKNIIKFKLKSKSEYAVVIIDLATMIKEFSGGNSNDYEKAIDLLHQTAKELKVHIILVVQAIQKTLENHRPSTLSAINIFRPILASIKNSSALAERSRTVLSVFRAKYYATRFFPDDPVVDTLEDVVEIQVLKSSNGNVGGIARYLHDEGMFRLFSMSEDYVPRTIHNVTRTSDDDEL